MQPHRPSPMARQAIVDLHRIRASPRQVVYLVRPSRRMHIGSTQPLRTRRKPVTQQHLPCRLCPQQVKASREVRMGWSRVTGQQQVQRKGRLHISEPRAWRHTRALELERCVAIIQDLICGWLTRMQLSAQLKTRLSYAMVKVQNGWEKQSLEELEESQSQRGSPNSAPEGSRVNFGSPSSTSYRRRRSTVSDSSDHMFMSPAANSVQPYALDSG